MAKTPRNKTVSDILNLTWVSNTQYKLGAGSFVTIGGVQYAVTSDIIGSLSGNLDVGSAAVNTNYNLFAVVSNGTLSVSHSLSFSSPLGFNATNSRYLWTIHTDASNFIIQFVKNGSYNFFSIAASRNGGTSRLIVDNYDGAGNQSSAVGNASLYSQVASTATIQLSLAHENGTPAQGQVTLGLTSNLSQAVGVIGTSWSFQNAGSPSYNNAIGEIQIGQIYSTNINETGTSAGAKPITTVCMGYRNKLSTL